MRWLERVVARHPDYRVVLAATKRDLDDGGESLAPRLRLDLVIASLGSLSRADLSAVGAWNATFTPRLGIVAITPPCAMLGTCALAALGVRHHLIAPVTEVVLRERLDRCLAHDDADAPDKERPREQREVDLVLQAALAMVPRSATHLPKGFSTRTLDVIVRELERIGAGTAQQVADAVGLSRVSVRRYLELLQRQGRVSVSHSYGQRGRPATVYALQDEPVLIEVGAT